MLRGCQQLASTVQKIEQSFLLLVRLQIYHFVQLNALFCCLWRNVEASRLKHFVSCYQHRRLLPAISVTTCGMMAWRRRIENTWSVAALTARSEARYRLRIAIFCLPHLHSTPALEGFPSEYYHTVQYGKTRTAWLADGEKKKISLFVLTECTNVTDIRTDRRTNRQTPHDGVASSSSSLIGACR